MRAGLSFSRSPISLLLRQPLSIKKSYAGAIQYLNFNVSDPYSVYQVVRLRLMGAPGVTHELCSYPAVLSSSNLLF
jgi:hypothetical protein